MANAVLGHAARLRRPGVIRSLQLGATTVTYVPDGDVRLRPLALFPDTTPEVWADHPEYLDATGNIVASIGALLVEHGDRALLIDTGFGPQELPAAPDGPRGHMQGGALLKGLAELGRGPESIEAVAFTHLHPDHIGWAWHAASGGDLPPFAHADHLVSEAEWAQRDALAEGGMAEQVAAMAPRVRTVADGQEIFPGVRVRITGGHTAGHVEYVIASGGQRLVAFGDALHSPIQVGHPEWSSAFDLDPVRSAEHRRALVAELAEPGTIAFGNHFADVTFGEVRDAPTSPTWHPLGTHPPRP